MGIEKLEKKLPEEIISIIDDEAAAVSISRQEAISRLMHSVTEKKYRVENELLKSQVKDLLRQISMKDDEISYLRGELTSLNKGLTRLAENLVHNNTDLNEVQSLLSPLKQEMTTCFNEVKLIQERMEKNDRNTYEKYIPIIFTGIFACLLVIFLIVSKVFG
ncbi:MAG: hypothetical protein GXY48_12080 [Methanomicrobiales archaeon]|nr:hypothetical protein [Methanomicrobiales archaeon]